MTPHSLPSEASRTVAELRRRPYRDQLIISTKAGYDMWPGPYGEWGSRKYLLASLDQSLRRMGLEYVDIFYSHRFDPDTVHAGMTPREIARSGHGWRALLRRCSVALRAWTSARAEAVSGLAPPPDDGGIAIDPRVGGDCCGR